MSRIGKKELKIPAEITVTLADHVLTVVGPKGTLTQSIPHEILCVIDHGTINFQCPSTAKTAKAKWGLSRALVNNMLIGVVSGFEKTMELVGVGLRAKGVSPSEITLTLGLSHGVTFKALPGVSLEVDGTQRLIRVFGTDKQQVGLTAAKLKKLKKPDPYKGKGVRYVGEYIKTKPGKAVKAK